MALHRSNRHVLACGINAQRLAFLMIYAKASDIDAAMKHAGYTSKAGCYQLLKNPKCIAVLQSLRAGEVLPGEAGETQRQLIEELKNIALADVRDVLEQVEIQTDNGPKYTYILADPDKWPERAAAAVSKLKFHPDDKGGGIAEVAFWNKNDAVKQLGALFSAAVQAETPQTPASATRKLTRADPIKAQDVLAGSNSAVMQDD